VRLYPHYERPIEVDRSELLAEQGEGEKGHENKRVPRLRAVTEFELIRAYYAAFQGFLLEVSAG
jgi:hypothetical protein